MKKNLEMHKSLLTPSEANKSILRQFKFIRAAEKRDLEITDDLELQFLTKGYLTLPQRKVLKNKQSKQKYGVDLSKKFYNEDVDTQPVTVAFKNKNNENPLQSIKDKLSNL